MKRSLIILAMLAMPFIGNAQKEVGSWTFIPKVGINIAKLTDPDIYIAENQKMEYTNKRPRTILNSATHPPRCTTSTSP